MKVSFLNRLSLVPYCHTSPFGLQHIFKWFSHFFLPTSGVVGAYDSVLCHRCTRLHVSSLLEDVCPPFDLRSYLVALKSRSLMGSINVRILYYPQILLIVRSSAEIFFFFSFFKNYVFFLASIQWKQNII